MKSNKGILFGKAIIFHTTTHFKLTLIQSIKDMLIAVNVVLPNGKATSYPYPKKKNYCTSQSLP